MLKKKYANGCAKKIVNLFAMLCTGFKIECALQVQ